MARFAFITRVAVRLAKLHSEGKVHGNLPSEFTMNDLRMNPDPFFEKSFEKSAQYYSDIHSSSITFINSDLEQLGKLISNLIKNIMFKMVEGWPHGKNWVTYLVNLLDETLVNPCLEKNKPGVFAAQIAYRLLYWFLSLKKFMAKDCSRSLHMPTPYHATHFVSVCGFQGLQKNLHPHFYSILHDFSDKDVRSKKFISKKRIHSITGPGHQIEHVDSVLYETSINLGASCFLKAIVTEEPIAIISAFPIIKGRLRTYSIRLKTTIFPRDWNDIHETEYCKIIRLERSGDKESIEAFEKLKDIPATQKKRNEIILSVFCIDHIPGGNFWYSISEQIKGNPAGAIHAIGLAAWLVHKPRVDDAGKNSFVPQVIDSYGRVHPWHDYRHRRGSISIAESKMLMGHNYLLGQCVEISLLPGDIFGKKAYIITIRLSDKLKIDFDVWVLEDNIIDGRATFTEERSLSIPAGTSFPEIGDLIFTEAWVQACAAAEQPTMSALTWSAPQSPKEATYSKDEEATPVEEARHMEKDAVDGATESVIKHRRFE